MSQAEQIITSLMFQVYGLAFFVLGMILLLIPKKDMSLSVCRHAGWLASFAISHSLAAYLAGAALDLNDPVTPWLIVSLTGMTFFSLFEFSRRLWNDSQLATRIVMLSPWLHLLFILPCLYTTYISNNPVAGLAAGFRLFLGTPASLLTGLAILNQVENPWFEKSGKRFTPWLKYTAAGFMVFAVVTPFVATTDPALAWVPNIFQFEAWTGIPIQVPRTLSAIIMASGFAVLLHNSTTLLVSELVKSSRLEEEENKYRHLFELTPNAIITFEKTTIIDCNQAALMLFGATNKDDLLGISISTLCPPTQPDGKDSDELTYEYGKYAYEHGQLGLEIVHRRLNGEDFPARVTLTNMDIGDVKVLQAIVSDITEQKQAEQEIRRHREHLEEMVEERTREVIKALDTAEKANKAKSLFLSNMSHELRTPLNAILGFSQLLQLKPPGAEKSKEDNYIDEIHNAGSHLLSLVNDLLDINQIEAGVMELNYTRVPVQELVDECVKQLQLMAHSHNIKIFQDCETGHSVWADRIRLKQVLINLLGNAIKYNRDNGHITISCMTAAPDRLTIKITDSGKGIPREDQERVFRPFERIHDGDTIIEGTGIGLTLSKSIIESMHGTIHLNSTPGRGSTFSLELPRSEMTEALQESREHDQTGAETTTPGTILYIEDDLPSLHLMKSIIERNGYLEILTCNNGQEGVRTAIDSKPGLILLDINMPGMDGYRVLEELQSNSATSGIPVVALSANALPEDIERGLDAGFTAYLTKPLNIRELFHTITTLLR